MSDFLGASRSNAFGCIISFRLMRRIIKSLIGLITTLSVEEAKYEKIVYGACDFVMRDVLICAKLI